MTETEVLEAALIGLEHQRSRLDDKMAELRRRLGVRGLRAASVVSAAMSNGDAAPGGKRRPMSAAGRRRIAEAQRKQWAALKHETAATATPVKKKRRISAAGRAAIVAATKKRWAAFHAAKKGSGKKKAAA